MTLKYNYARDIKNFMKGDVALVSKCHHLCALMVSLQIPRKCYIDIMKKLTLRLSESLHDSLKQLSLRENRSLHGEIVYRLKRAIDFNRMKITKKELNDA